MPGCRRCAAKAHIQTSRMPHACIRVCNTGPPCSPVVGTLRQHPGRTCSHLCAARPPPPKKTQTHRSPHHATQQSRRRPSRPPQAAIAAMRSGGTPAPHHTSAANADAGAGGSCRCATTITTGPPGPAPPGRYCRRAAACSSISRAPPCWYQLPAPPYYHRSP